MSEKKDSIDRKDEKDEIQFVKEIDPEALDVIKRLYDKTFRELVDR